MNRRGISSFFASVARVFAHPFDGLPLVLWCFVVLSYIAMPRNPVWLGDLPDPDDYTYLTQTLDWLQGQSWFDLTQHRMSPPEGVAIHYTRFAQMPMAALIMMFRAFHYTWQGAALLTSYLLPVIYLAIMFTALRWVAEKFVGVGWARLTTFIVLFAPPLMFKFAPGQVDHHGLEAILTMLAVGCAARMFAHPARIGWAVAAGVVLALAMAIALEVLPWVLLISALIGLWVTVEGVKAARAAASFGLTLFIASAWLLTLDRAPADIFTQDMLAYSIVYVDLAGGIALALLAACAFARVENIKLRFALSGIVAVVLGGIYLRHFPALFDGPYGAMDAKLAVLFFGNLQEAAAMATQYGFYKNFLYVAPLLLGLVVCFQNMRRAQDGKRWSWALLALLLAAATALALFYQMRVLMYAQIFAVIPLVAFVEQGWAWLSAHTQGRRRFWAEIALVLIVGPLPAILLPALQDGRSFSTGVILFPGQSFDDTCTLIGTDRLLNDAAHGGAQSRIVNFIDQGPELLFRTRHAVLSAPYHTNVRGNLDALDFFAATDPEQAHQIAIRDGIGLVVMCRNVPDMYLAGPPPHYVVTPDGVTHMRPNASLAGQLAAGHIPGWLTEIPATPGTAVFEVKPK
ncbi:MAG: hypothetical protein P4M15_06500 [Alphaproteobacteria bacterium]|nr:hypothetical protein [Alphaproteobacteria bacterium]